MPPRKTATAKSKGKSNIWFVTGNDESGVKKAALDLSVELSPGDDPFGMDVIDGSGSTVDEITSALGSTLEAILTLPMFGGDKLVWLKNTTAFSDGAGPRSESVKQMLEKLIETAAAGLPEGMRLLISAPEPDKRKTVVKEFSKMAQTTVCDKPDFGWNATEADVVDWVLGRAESAGLRIGSRAAEVLAARVGADTRQIDVELEKLSVAVQDSEVEEHHIRDLVPPTRQGGIFDLSTAILQKDLPGALGVMDQLFKQRSTAMEILLVAIVPTVRNLLLTADLMKRHQLRPPGKAFYFGKTLEELPVEATAHLPRKKDGAIKSYPLGLAAMSAPLFDAAHLRNCLVECRTVNRQLITQSLDESILLGKLLIRTLCEPAHS